MHCHVCVRKIQYEGVCREANTAQGKAECCICLETPPKCCIFRTHKQGGALSVILYFLDVWLGAIFSSTQTAVIFDDQDISNRDFSGGGGKGGIFAPPENDFADPPPKLCPNQPEI